MSDPFRSMTDPVIALKELGGLLGKSDFDWATKEQRWFIACEFEGINQNLLSTLTPEPFNACFDAYGNSLTASGFFTEDMLELDCRGHITQHDLDELAKIVDKDETLIFRFRLDKHLLLANWFGPGTQRATRYLYLFEKAFTYFLESCSLRDLEHLWDNKPTDKVIILLPNYAFTYDGSLLAVLGKKNVADWQTFVPHHAIDKNRLDSIIETRKGFSVWEKPWVDFLTPLHLQIERRTDSRISTLLSSHWINSILIYTAGRVTGLEKPLAAIYSGSQQTVQVKLVQPKTACLDIDEKENYSSMQHIWNWAYDPTFAFDRLEFVQIVVTQYLLAAEQEIRSNLLLHNAQEILKGLKWHWQAFIEKKIEGYTAQVRELEAYVDKTIDIYTGQVSEMIGSVSETILAAIAAILGTFIVSLFREKMNITIFTLGMILYAVYVYIFPFRFRFWNQMERFVITTENFEKRCAEYEKYLYKTRVNEIVGDRASKSQERFLRWAKRVKTTYIVVIILAICASYISVIVGIVSFFLTKFFADNHAMISRFIQ